MLDKNTTVWFHDAVSQTSLRTSATGAQLRAEQQWLTSLRMSKSRKGNSKKTIFQVGTKTNKNISSYLKISASHQPESWAKYNIYNMVKHKIMV